MPSKLKVLQVIPKLGYGGAETGCYDIAHYLYENDCKSYIITSGGELIKFVNKKKVKLIRLPVQSKNPIIMLLNALIISLIILYSFYQNLSFFTFLQNFSFVFSDCDSPKKVFENGLTKQVVKNF